MTMVIIKITESPAIIKGLTKARPEAKLWCSALEKHLWCADISGEGRFMESLANSRHLSEQLYS